MAIKKEVDVFVNVNDKDLKTLNSDLGKTEQSFKDVQKEANKTSASVDDVASNGGAIAMLDQVTGGLATRFKDAFEATKLFNGSLKGMRTALIATGIGALVVALGVVVAYWDEIEELITGANARLEEYLQLSNKQTSALEAQLGLLNKQIESNTLQGKATEALQKQRVELLKRTEALNVAQQGILKTQIARLKLAEKEIELTDVLASAWAFIKGGFAGVAREAQDIALERRQEILELEAALTGAETKAIDLEIALFKIDNPEGEEPTNEPQTRDKVVSVLDPNLKSEQVKVLDDLKDFEFQKTEIEELASDNRIEIARLEAMAKAEAMSSYSDSLASISGVIGQQTVEGKALAVASSLISTYASISGTLAAFSGVPVPGYAIAQAIATGVVGFANVKKIIDVKVPGGGAGGGGGSVPSVGGGTRAPEFNLVKGTASNQIAESIQGQDQPIKAFVVSSDVTSSQELSRNIEGDSSL